MFFQSIDLMLLNFNSVMSSLKEGEATFLGAIISGLFTVSAAYLAVTAAFIQLQKQFEHKIIYEGWKDLQEKLFFFSNKLSAYIGKVQRLGYVLDSQNNPIINGGSRNKYIRNKWQEIMNSYEEMNKANGEFLRSFENHEVIFEPLGRMKRLFQKEVRVKVNDIFLDFYEEIFPEIYGSTKSVSRKDIKLKIDQHLQDLISINTYLSDFRVELQNETVGKILDKKVSTRKPDKGLLILTRKGFKLQKVQPFRYPEDT